MLNGSGNHAPLFMGIEIARDRTNGKLTITQTKYIGKIVDTFLTSSTSKTFSTPPVHTSRILMLS